MSILIDVLNVPDTMRVPLGAVWGIAIVITPFLFTAAIATEQAKVIKGETPRYNDVIWNTVWVFLGLVLYRYMFTKILSFCEGIGMTIMSYQNWVNLIAIINQKINGTPDNLFTVGIPDLFAKFAMIITTAVEEIFNAVRFMFLSVLYIIGPLALVSAIYKPIKSLCKGWFINLFQVSFWIVILRVFQIALVSFQAEQYINQEDFLVTIVICIAFIFAMVSTPFFTASLLSGETLGVLGSALTTGGAFMAAKVAGGVVGKVAGGGVTGIGKVFSSVSKNKTSTVSGNDTQTISSPAPLPKSKEPDTTPKPEKTR